MIGAVERQSPEAAKVLHVAAATAEETEESNS